MPGKSTLYSCLNVKELLARNRSVIWSLSNRNRIWAHKHLVHKQTLKHLAKLAILAKCLRVCLRTKWLWVRVLLHLLKLQITPLFRARSSLATIECRFTLKRVCDMIITCSHKYFCLNEVIWLMAMKMGLKMKNRSHRYDIKT